MAKQTLPTNFVDDIFAPSANGKRKFTITDNGDGTYEIEDVTEYAQTGSDFGAGQINATNQAVNESCDKANVIETMDDIVANHASGMIAGAKAVAELNGNISESGSWELIGIKTNRDRIYIDTSKYKTVFCEVRNYEQYASIYLPVEYINTIDSTIEKAFTSGGYMSSAFPGMWFEIKAGKMGGATQPYVYWNRGFVNGNEITGNYGLSVWGQI